LIACLFRRCIKNDRKRLPPSARREKILKAALRFLATHGYEKFRFRNVAAHANVHFATIQYHFKSKDALLSALIETKLARDKALLKTALEKAEGSPKEKFVKAIALMASESQDPYLPASFLSSGHCPITTKRQ
jgi:AcrR family transcriptional regulator